LLILSAKKLIIEKKISLVSFIEKLKQDRAGYLGFQVLWTSNLLKA